ncbi:hypothetical protein ACP4OV_000250 [Aristida adscensionis]
MGRGISPPRRPSSSSSAAALVLLLLAVLFCGPAAACVGGAPGGGGGGCGTDLQKHVGFFDGNGDGIITMGETYNGFRSLGFGPVASSASAVFINSALGPITRPPNATSPMFDIYIENIQKGIHGSDTGSYDAQGKFVPEKFNEIFSKHGKTQPDALTSDEVDEMLNANSKPGDAKGSLAAKTEWKVLYGLAKDQNGLLHKADVRRVYDGSLFYDKKEEVASSKKPH